MINEKAHTDITSSLLFFKSQITQLKSLLKICLPAFQKKRKSLSHLLRQDAEVIGNDSNRIFIYLFSV